MQEPLSDKDIEELIAEFLEVESKVSMVLFLVIVDIDFRLPCILTIIYGKRSVYVYNLVLCPI